MPKFRKHSIEEKRKRSKLRRKRKKAAKKESGSRDQPFASKKRSDLTDDRSVIQRKDYGKKWSQVAKFFNQGRIEQTVKQLLVQNCQELNSTTHFGTQLQFQYTYTCLKKIPKLDRITIDAIFFCLLNCFIVTENTDCRSLPLKWEIGLNAGLFRLYTYLLI